MRKYFELFFSCSDLYDLFHHFICSICICGIFHIVHEIDKILFRVCHPDFNSLCHSVFLFSLFLCICVYYVHIVSISAYSLFTLHFLFNAILLFIIRSLGFRWEGIPFGKSQVCKVQGYFHKCFLPFRS